MGSKTALVLGGLVVAMVAAAAAVLVQPLLGPGAKPYISPALKVLALVAFAVMLIGVARSRGGSSS